MLDLGGDVKTRPLPHHHHLPLLLQSCRPHPALLPHLPLRRPPVVRQVSSRWLLFQEDRNQVPCSCNKPLLLLAELPGFYFDPEKNRYFRLLPGHNNCNPLTKEKLQEKEREKQRNLKLAEDENPIKVCLLFYIFHCQVFFFLIWLALHFLESTKERMEHLTATAEEKVWLTAAGFLLQVLLVYTKGHRAWLLHDNSIEWKYIPRRIHEVKVSAMRRHKVEIHSTDNSNPNTDNFRLIVVRWTLAAQL